MTKKVTFGARPERSTSVAADAWVSDRATTALDTPEAKEPTKRLTIDVSAELHRRIKVQCALRGVNIADVLRELLDQEFPSDKTGPS